MASEVKAQLDLDVKRAQTMLRRLSDPNDDLAQKIKLSPFAKPQRLPGLDPGLVWAAKGLVFTLKAKGGCITSGIGGHAFLIKKLSNTPGERMWSAPLFLKIGGASAGLTLGFIKTESLMVLESDKCVDAFHKSQLMTNPDAAVAAGPPRFAKVGFALPHSSRTHRESKQFNVPLGGGVLDLSCAFANFARDDRKMLDVYQERWSTGEVMDGTVVAPPELEPLYRQLDDIVSEYLNSSPVLSKLMEDKAALAQVLSSAAAARAAAEADAAAKANCAEPPGHDGTNSSAVAAL